MPAKLIDIDFQSHSILRQIKTSVNSFFNNFLKFFLKFYFFEIDSQIQS